MTKQSLITVLSEMADTMEENKIYLTSLDTEIGDGDHGINMARGFSSIKAKLPEMAEMSIGEILTACGKILIRDVAGSSGPLYGSAFKCAGKVIGDRTEITAYDFADMLDSGTQKIMALGKATEGEKTMLDAMLPALRSLKETKSVTAALAEAEKGMEHTKEIIATKGRASYVGERSLGHQDPGATSFVMLLRVIERGIAK